MDRVEYSKGKVFKDEGVTAAPLEATGFDLFVIDGVQNTCGNLLCRETEANK